jgi:hypothetical protein
MEEKPEKKIAHLQLINQSIVKTSSACLTVKGWCVAFVSAFVGWGLHGLSVPSGLLIGLYVVALFLAVDSYILAHEDNYKRFYEEVRKKDESAIDFLLRPNDATFQEEVFAWRQALGNPRNRIFYGLMGGAIVLAVAAAGIPWPSLWSKVFG